MGTPIPDPITGVNCPNWDPPAETPQYLYAMFWDIVKGDNPAAVQAPNLHIFKLEQKPGSPCVWEFWNPVSKWWVQVGIAVAETWLWLGDDDIAPNYYFVDHKAVSPPVEYEIFTNDFQSPLDDWGYGGTGTIFWLPTVIDLAESFGLDGTEDLLLEMFAAPSADFVHKFCSLILRTNIKIKYSP